MSNYQAKIINYGIGETKAKELAVIINFKVKKTEGDYTDMMWQGSLKEGRAREITLDALLVCGLSDNNLERVAKGDGLDKEKVVQVTIEQEEYNGKMYDRIRWINEVGSGQKEMLAASDAILRLKGLSLEANIMERKSKNGKPSKQDEIPF